MNLIDVVLLVGLAVALVSGARAGLAAMVVTTLSGAIGVVLGVLLAPRVVDGLGLHGGARTVVFAAVLFGAFGLASAAFAVVASAATAALRAVHLGGVDRALGAALAGGATVMVAWLLGGLLATSPTPAVAALAQRSLVLRSVDSALPPLPGVLAEVQRVFGDHGMPLPFAGFEPDPDSQPLPPASVVDALAARAAAAVVRVQGPGCGGTVTGSGVVLAPGVVVTNAHVVAGVRAVEVVEGDAARPARVVLFDPDADLALLKVSGLQAAPLPLAGDDARSGDAGVVLGYPGGGPFDAQPAVVLSRQQALGRDIYGDDLVWRTVYVVGSVIRPGNSGGPLVGPGGAVLGVVFASSRRSDDVGYALTASEVRPRLSEAATLDQPVSTGGCAVR